MESSGVSKSQTLSLSTRWPKNNDTSINRVAIRDTLRLIPDQLHYHLTPPPTKDLAERIVRETTPTCTVRLRADESVILPDQTVIRNKTGKTQTIKYYLYSYQLTPPRPDSPYRYVQPLPFMYNNPESLESSMESDRQPSARIAVPPPPPPPIFKNTLTGASKRAGKTENPVSRLNQSEKKFIEHLNQLAERYNHTKNPSYPLNIIPLDSSSDVEPVAQSVVFVRNLKRIYKLFNQSSNKKFLQENAQQLYNSILKKLLR